MQYQSAFDFEKFKAWKSCYLHFITGSSVVTILGNLNIKLYKRRDYPIWHGGKEGGGGGGVSVIP